MKKEAIKWWFSLTSDKRIELVNQYPVNAIGAMTDGEIVNVYKKENKCTQHVSSSNNPLNCKWCGEAISLT